MLCKTSLVQLLPARALDDEPDGDVIAGYRIVTNGPHRVGNGIGHHATQPWGD